MENQKPKEDVMAAKPSRLKKPVVQLLPALHVYKVALKYNKSIWRRIEISSTQTVEDLHWAIFDAFDRDDEHLYAFYLMKPGYRGRKALREAERFVHPAAFDPYDERARDASKVQLGELAMRRGRKFEYEFDFGDEWWHEITFEGERPANPKVKYPRVAESKGESPPQYPHLEDDEDW